MRKIAFSLLCIVFIMALFPSAAKADMGPKPSVVINFTGLEGKTYYVTLLSSVKSTGPFSAPGDNYQKHRKDEIFLEFAGYQDSDGFYFLQYFKEDGAAQKYNRYITLNYENAYRPPITPPGALSVLKKALRGADNNSVTFLAIGPLNNLANLISDSEGYSLVKDKVRCLVTMSTGLEKPEWNVVMDIPSAQTVFERWPSPIVVSVFETGLPIITGRSFGSMPADHPLPVAYRLFTDGDEKQGRMSWDLTAAWYAIAGTEPFFYLSSPCSVTIDAAGMAHFKDDPQGNVRILHNKMDPEQIAQNIDNMWTV